MNRQYLLTPEQAKATVNALENLVGVCISCNPSKGGQLPGNVPGTWLLPNPTPQAVELMKKLGTWKE